MEKYVIYKKNSLLDFNCDNYKNYNYCKMEYELPFSNITNSLKEITENKRIILKDCLKNLNENEYLVISLYKNDDLLRTINVEQNQIKSIIDDPDYLLENCLHTFCKDDEFMASHFYLMDNNVRNMDRTLSILNYISLDDIAREYAIIKLKLLSLEVFPNNQIKSFRDLYCFCMCDCKNNLSWVLRDLKLYRDNGYFNKEFFDNFIFIIEKYMENNNYKPLCNIFSIDDIKEKKNNNILKENINKESIKENGDNVYGK